MRIPTLPLAIGLLFLSMAAPASAAEEPAKKNVLFLICDDLNCDLGTYGHRLVKSPNIDRLASRGVRFERAYCQYPLCGPSRASFMTGMYPDQTSIHGNAILIRAKLPDSLITMTQMFMNNGYTAARIGKIYHYNVPKGIGTPGHDDPASWSTTFNPIGRDKAEEDLIFTLQKGQFGGTLSWLSADGTDAEQTDGIAAEHADQLLAQFAKQKTPFFLAVGMYRPHTPYVAPHKYFEMYPQEKIKVPQVPKGYLQTIPEAARQSLTRKREQAQQAIQAYYASTTFVDAQIGLVLESLKQHGLAENTVVLFTSDHGYHMGEHGYYQKTTLFENAARVPLIISVPGMKTAGSVAHTPVEMVDFYPTLAELCGLQTPDTISGTSLAAVLDDPKLMPRESALTQFNNGYSIRTPRYRYTEWGKAGSGGNELYDHEEDPAEMHNLANSPTATDAVAKLRTELHRRIAEAQKLPPSLRTGDKAGE